MSKANREQRIVELAEALCFDLEACQKAGDLDDGDLSNWDKLVERIRLGLLYEEPNITADQVREKIRGIPVTRLNKVLEAAINGDDADSGKKPDASNGAD